MGGSSGMKAAAVILLVAVVCTDAGWAASAAEADSLSAAARPDSTESLATVGRVTVGDAAPWLAGWTTDDRVFNLRRALDDSTTARLALVFWATWCAPCRVGIAMLDAARDELADAGVAVVLVNAAEDAATVQAYLDANPAGFPVLMDRFGQNCDRWLNEPGGGFRLPRTVLVERDGTVGAVFGAEGRDYVERIIAGR